MGQRPHQPGPTGHRSKIDGRLVSHQVVHQSHRNGNSSGMTDRAHGISPDQLTDDDLRRELTHLHETRHDTVLAGSESALATHTRRMLALEQEFIRRFPEEAAPEPLRTRAGSRREHG
jgi:hypothetical protein